MGTSLAVVPGAETIGVLNPQRPAYVVIRTERSKDKDRSSFNALSQDTTVVHLNGYPFLWAIERILDKAPNVKTIQMIPSMHSRLTLSHRELLERNQVAITKGHYKPEYIWARGENRSPGYAAQQKFFKELSLTQRRLFNELLAIGVSLALVTHRYFCLNGEPFLPQLEVANQFGFGATSSSYVSSGVHAIMYYLDPSQEVCKKAKVMAAIIHNTVQPLRAQYGDLLQNEDLPKRMNEILREATGETDACVPEGLPLSLFDTYKKVRKAFVAGELNKLRRLRPKKYRALVTRFGLTDGIFRTYQVCGKVLKSQSHRICDDTNWSLKFLGITVDL